MKRRAVLAGTSTLAAAALAGCLADPPGSGETPVGGDTPTDTPTTTDTPTPADTPTPQNRTGTDTPATSPGVSDTSFEILSVSSGSAENSAKVSYDDGVTVDGTIGGNNGCYTARLASARLSDGTLTVVVEAYENRDEDQSCTQALVDIDYEASISFEGDLPERVVVEHESMGDTHEVADETR